MRYVRKQSQVLIRIFEQIPIQYCEINLIKALEIAKELNIYAYDAYMIECARIHRTPLLTLDASVKEKAIAKKITVLGVQ
jgi:predicted nucleic acid-binding protein